LLFGLAPYAILGQSDLGTLRVAIHDKASGEVVPAMVCITSLADNTWRVPPDGTIVSPGYRPPGYRLKRAQASPPPPIEWSPGDIGPVALTVNVPLPGISLDLRSDLYPMYAGLPPMPYWNEPVAYFVSKPFTITLPPGKWRLAVSRGPEYLPVFEEFTIAPQQKLERDIRLARWVDMRQQGWYSGDPHFHLSPWRNDLILMWGEAQDIHMTTVLSVGGRQPVAYGKDSHYQRGDYALAAGHEGPRTEETEQGHLLQLNMKAAVLDPMESYQYGSRRMDMVCDILHEQGGLCGYAHMSHVPYFLRSHPDREIHPTWDASINAIRGKIDFFEILQHRQLAVEDYYDFLNMGVKLTASTGSDPPAGNLFGESRTYIYTGRGKFSPDTWYAGFKQGRTFITNGPMLTLAVGGAMPGDEVRVRKNAKLRVHAQAWAPEAIGAPKVLEVLSHGRVIRSVESRGPKQDKLTAEFELPASESQWIVARTTSYNAGVALTSPVYVIVDGASFADRAQLPQLVEKRLKILNFIERRLRDPEYTQHRGYSASDLPLLMESIQDARARYQAILAAGRVSVTAHR